MRKNKKFIDPRYFMDEKLEEAQVTPTSPPVVSQLEPEPEPESASTLARFLARIKDTLTLSPETWKDLNDVARKMHDDEMMGYGPGGDTPRYMESLNIEIGENNK